MGGRAPDTLQPADDWRARAACREEDPELFFPVGQGPDATAQTGQAKEVCRRCPVMDQCLQWALETRQDAGVWGGASEQERKGMRIHAGNRSGARELAPCGTVAAYRRHIKNNEPADPACRAAYLTDKAAQAAQAKEKRWQARAGASR